MTVFIILQSDNEFFDVYSTKELAEQAITKELEETEQPESNRQYYFILERTVQ